MRFKFFFLILFLSFTICFSQTKYPEINQEMANGNFSKATELINEKICSGELQTTEIYDLNFQIDRMDRIRQDFNKSKEDMYKFIVNYYPDVSNEDFEKWESDNSLEHMIIDGEKKYFARAHSNLFRINREAKQRKIEVDGDSPNTLTQFLSKNLPEVISESNDKEKQIVKPVRYKLKYTLTVDVNAVPDGEIIRCWLPYPSESHLYQTDVKLLSVNSDEYIIADKEHLQRTLYLEKVAEKDQPTIFQMELSYTCFARYYQIDPNKVKPYNKGSELYKEFTAEREPHIVFTDRVKSISEKVVGDETNPYLIAKKIFEWTDENIPWAGAREYSTIENITEYALVNSHGDCGIQTLVFMTLCRYNGIPTKWQSGWMFHPDNINLHDWGEVYFEGYGWVPVDQSFGIQNSSDENLKYFFLGGLDAYRLIVNDDYSVPLYPSKIFPRSETVDFQRGEVEWRCGNLYFDKWDYHMDVEYLK